VVLAFFSASSLVEPYAVYDAFTDEFEGYTVMYQTAVTFHLATAGSVTNNPISNARVR
jgi:hypothetical protein